MISKELNGRVNGQTHLGRDPGDDLCYKPRNELDHPGRKKCVSQGHGRDHENRWQGPSHCGLTEARGRNWRLHGNLMKDDGMANVLPCPELRSRTLGSGILESETAWRIVASAAKGSRK